MKYLLPLLLLFSSTAFGADPKLNFTDLISGPDTGVGDSLGSGVIVTVWGQFLGSSKGTSTIEFCDFLGTCRQPYIYYWKNADGALPSGPSNLFESHGMHEIAFSIPDSAMGAGSIQVTVNGVVSNTLPFTVRTGPIYHVTSTGTDGNNSGDFAAPWLTVKHAITKMSTPGSTVYIHNVDSGTTTNERGIYWNKGPASSSLAAQFGFVAYPNTRPTSTGAYGFTNYNVDGQVVSKFDVYASNRLTVNANGQPTNETFNGSRCIETDRYGRIVGIRCTDIVGACASGQQGAINGNALNGNEIEGSMIFGNEIHDYGCEGSNKLHHTTYFSIRSGNNNLQIDPWRFGWNYLHNNHAKNGIHMFDQENGGSTECGSATDTVIIHDNVVVNQGGAGITISSNCNWNHDFDIYNNLLINTGNAASWNGIDVNTSDGPVTSGILIRDNGLNGTISLFNNTIVTWNDDDQANAAQSCVGMRGTGLGVTVLWNNNLCYTLKDKKFVGSGDLGTEANQLQLISGLDSVWYYTGITPTNAIFPAFDTKAITTDPLLTITGVKAEIASASSAIDVSSSLISTHDLYGYTRLPDGDIGAIEYSKRPPKPTGIVISVADIFMNAFNQ